MVVQNEIELGEQKFVEFVSDSGRMLLEKRSQRKCVKLAVRAVNLGDVEVVELEELVPKREDFVPEGQEAAVDQAV